jgi:ribonuclease P protein component
VNSGRAVGETFSRGDRLRKRSEFEECYSSGVRVSGRHFLLFLRRPPEIGRPRIGISVSRRVGDAVTRNRVKRRLREIFRKERPFENVEIVVNARPSAATAEFSELRRDFADVLAKALSRGKRPA